MMDSKMVRKIDTRALGITNKMSAEEVVEKGLVDDERLLTDAFKIFNQEFYDGKLLEPIIHISPAVKENVGIKITDSEEWIKHDNGKKEWCRGLYISDKILKYGVVSEMGMENAYIMLAVGMITLYDKEMREAYNNGTDIRDGDEKAIADRKERNNNRRKKKYKGMVTRNGYYYTAEFAAECARIGIIAKAIVDAKGVPTGRYETEAGELFLNVLKKHDLLDRRFVCAKYQQVTPEVVQQGINIKTELIEVKSSSVRTYQCPICKLNVRGTKSGLRIKCCNEEHVGSEPFMVELERKKKELAAIEQHNNGLIAEKHRGYICD